MHLRWWRASTPSRWKHGFFVVETYQDSIIASFLAGEVARGGRGLWPTAEAAVWQREVSVLGASGTTWLAAEIALALGEMVVCGSKYAQRKRLQEGLRRRCEVPWWPHACGGCVPGPVSARLQWPRALSPALLFRDGHICILCVYWGLHVEDEATIRYFFQLYPTLSFCGRKKNFTHETFLKKVMKRNNSQLVMKLYQTVL